MILKAIDVITVLRKTHNKALFYKIDFSEYSWQIFFASTAGEIIKVYRVILEGLYYSSS